MSAITEDEKATLAALGEAWNLFVKLGDPHPADLDEFCRAIHAAQNIIACRVARRVDPETWWK